MEDLRIQILELLKENSKIPVEDMAKMLDQDVEVIEEAIRAMEEDGTIIKYSTVINWEKASDEQVVAMIDVKVAPKRGQGFDALAERIYRFPEVQSVYLMSGGYDLSVIIEGKNLKQVANFVSARLSPLEDVVSTTTHFILKKYKENGVILHEKNEDCRLVISP